MLPGQDGGGAEDGALLAVHDALKSRPEGHLGFAEAHVPAQQPFHGGLLLHVRLDLGDAPQLVVGFLIIEMGLKIPLVIGVRGKGVAFHLHPLGVQSNELVGHFVHGFFDPSPGFLPLPGVQPVQFDLGILPGADILADQVQLGNRHIQGVRPGVFDFNVVFDNAVQIQLVDAVKNPDAVGHMHHVIPNRQVGKGLDLLPLALFRRGGGNSDGLAGGGQGKFDLRVLEPRRQGPGQHQHLPVLDSFQILDVRGRQSHFGQVGGQIGRSLGRPCQHGAAVALFQQGHQVAVQELQISVPAG